VVSGGRVVFNTESCTLFVVDADTGEPAWSRWLGDPLMAQPAVHAGVVFMAYPHADRSHRLAAFALGDGAVLWETPLAGDVISAPVVAGDSVYATTFDGCVHRLLRSSGETVWRRDMRATSAPWVHGDEVHVSQRTPGGPSVPLEGFTSLRGTGELLRGMSSSRPARYLDDEMQSHSSYGSSTSTSDAYVGFGSGPPPSSKSWVAAGNVGQRTVRGLWEYQGSRPTVLGDRSYATQGTSVRASETRTGTPCWERELPGDLRTLGGHLGSPPACAGGKVVVGTASGEVIAFAAGSGEVALRVPLGEEVRFQPALVRGRVHVGTTRGGLVAFDTGDPTLDGWTMWGGGPCHNGAEAA
jgi:Ca-activated chloride channel family protein